MAKKQLQEMDVAAGTKQSKTAVNANAKPADADGYISSRER